MTEAESLCAICQTPASHTCSRCKSVRYCGRKCQNAAWQEHKKVCKRAGPKPPKPWKRFDIGKILTARIDDLTELKTKAADRPKCSEQYNNAENEYTAHLFLESMARADMTGLLPALNTKSGIYKQGLMDITRIYALFYAEWDAFMGPDPAELIPLKMPFQSGEETQKFPSLYPNGTGHWRGPVDYPDTFEGAVIKKLQLDHPKFQKNKGWLHWSLTRTEDREVAALINCVLVGLHSVKSRHLGGGNVETIPFDADFELLVLNEMGMLVRQT